MTADRPSEHGADLGAELSRYAGRPVYLHEVSGNNGDELILRGSEYLVDRAGCVRVGDPAKAEAILINGGFKSDFWPFANDTIRDYSRRFPNVPMIILPSSFLFEETDFPSLFAGRNAPVTLFARELPSLERLRSMRFDVPVEFGLDHDTAFALRDHPHFQRLAHRTPDHKVLVVERGDAERVTPIKEESVVAPSRIRSMALRVLPRPAALGAARIMARARRAGSQIEPTPFARHAIDLAKSDPDTPAIDKACIADISRRSACSFKEFCTEVASSEVVVSTRLHVAVLGAILNRKTYIVAGDNHKIPGIYEYSMSNLDHVSMVNSECQVIG